MITSDVKFKASVCCMTYNQNDYIEDTLRGFALQSTTFPYVCMVLDDASTDGEPGVIKYYLNEHFDLTEQSGAKRDETADYTAILCRHKSNKNCYFAVFFLKYNHYQNGKSLRRLEYYSSLMSSVEFTGFCEGDDFWISPNFLQISVDYLTNHTAYSSVFGNKLVSDEKGSVIKKIKFQGGLTIHDIMRGHNMGLRNLLFRKECLFVSPFETSFRDLHVYYKCAVSGRMKYIDSDFAVYRLTGKGVCSSLQEKDVVYTSYLHYYDFHKFTNFRFQKDYVNYQIRIMMGNLSNPLMFRYCCKLIHHFHVPSKLRYFWYIQFGVLLFAAQMKCLFQTNKS